MTPDQLEKPVEPTLDLNQYIQIGINTLIPLGAGWLAKIGFDDNSAGVLAGVIAGIVLIFVKAKLEREKLLKTDPNAATPGPSLPPPTGLRSLLVVGLIGTLLLGGCASDQATQVKDAELGVETAATSIKIAVDAGLVPENDKPLLDSLLVDAADVVNEMVDVRRVASTQPGGVASVADYVRGLLQQFNAKAADLANQLAAAKAKAKAHKTPSTPPAAKAGG